MNCTEGELEQALIDLAKAASNERGGPGSTRGWDLEVLEGVLSASKEEIMEAVEQMDDLDYTPVTTTGEQFLRYDGGEA